MIRNQNPSAGAGKKPASGFRVGGRLAPAVITAGVIGLTAALLRCFLLLHSYDPQSGYYSAAEPGLLPYFMWLIVVFGLLLSVWTVLRHSSAMAGSAPGSAGLPVLLLSSGMACVWIAVLFVQFRLRAAGTISSPLAIVAAALSALAAFVTLADAVVPVEGVHYGRASLSLLPAAAMVLIGFEVYFDQTLVLNSPNKPIFMLSVCTTLLFLVLRCRFFSGTPHSVLFVFSGLAVVLLGLFSGVPGLVWYFVRGEALLIHAVFDVLLIVSSLYAAVLLLSLRRGEDGAEPEAPEMPEPPESAEASEVSEPRETPEGSELPENTDGQGSENPEPPDASSEAKL